MRFRKAALVIMICLFLVSSVQARQRSADNQILYRQGKLLYLADTETGDVRPLPDTETSNFDVWKWSPDGQYLLGMLRPLDQINLNERFLRIYDVENKIWLGDLNIGLGDFLGDAEWSPNSKQVAYSRNQNGQTELSVFDLSKGENHLLYQTLPSDGVHDQSIYQIWWSPSGTHMLFKQGYQIMGGTLNSLHLINSNTGNSESLYERYYADYVPMWSPDGKWILLDLEDSYYSPGIFDDGEYGDVYLFNTSDSTNIRVTNTPEVRETNLRWSQDGNQIIFDTEEHTIMANLQSVLDHGLIPSETTLSIEITPTKSSPLGVIEFPSPDDSQIAYLKYNVVATKYDLYVADTTGKPPLSFGQLDDAQAFLGWRP